MNKWLYLGSLVFFFSLGLYISPILSYAQLAIDEVVDKGIYTLTKADKFYVATSTVSMILSDVELVKVKEEYNNTDRIVQELKEINKNLITLIYYAKNN